MCIIYNIEGLFLENANIIIVRLWSNEKKFAVTETRQEIKKLKNTFYKKPLDIERTMPFVRGRYYGDPRSSISCRASRIFGIFFIDEF